MKNFTILLMLGALLTGCASDTKEKTPDYYEGPSGDASISTDNAADIVEFASGMQSLQFSFIFGVFGKPQDLMHNKTASRASVELSTPGECGGTAKYTATETSIKVDFNDYCTGSGEDQSKKNGTLKWVVTDENTDDIDYTLDITETRGSDTMKTYGSMKTLTTDNGFKMTFNLSHTDSSTGESYSLDNYVFEIGDSSDYFALSGKLCSSEIDGCITIATVTPFVLSTDNFFGFDSGEMTITAGSDVISVKTNSDGQCDVVATINGVDTTIDTDSCFTYLF